MTYTEHDMPTGICFCGCGEKTTVHEGFPRRFIHGHQVRTRNTTPHWIEEDRGYETSCLIWNRAKNPRGYGLSYGKASEGEGRRRGVAHKIRWEELHGPVPPGKELHHRCEQEDCGNDEHLELLTRAQNCRLKQATKLTMEKAREIRASTLSQAALGRKYGVSRSCIKSVLIETTWKEE